MNRARAGNCPSPDRPLASPGPPRDINAVGPSPGRQSIPHGRPGNGAPAFAYVSRPCFTLVDNNRARWQAVCKVCGRTFPVSDNRADELAATGWPVCCDRDMSIHYHPGGAPPADPPPSQDE